MTDTAEAPSRRRPDTRASGRTAPGVRRWVRVLAHAAALTPLPSGLWRVAMGLGVPLGFAPESVLHESNFPGWATWYVIGLSLFAEGLALLTLGLVQRWGEVAPRWIPWAGGRRIPVLAAVLPALAGAAALTVIAAVGASGWNDPDNLAELEYPFGPAYWVQTACYAPLLAWGPLLAVVTIAYWHRRRTAAPPR
ncbi:hypothetical protein [Marinitenerispora sediminis]|uniref:DUF3995 domain-containing protein n=1 Tax=Marinitenerispora sediminis TaxID=1931232 RepID=A0A368T2L5_9ACTN|nr:hypothetical protein [Marinitenerispora sediminis]RCV52112.1 hypothetical protein DEF28_13770 [Marinitenerispora sediminis]RCV55531.1 hypothetical protein DEF24_17785 [Marinitenerispora sediminis]RCV57835.1 hypothetical protein DEF23_10010 [Marinitenerispora sediminis]